MSSISLSQGIFGKFRRVFTLQMATKMETVKQNAELAKQTISALKSELTTLNNEYNVIRAQQLREENAKLTEAVETARKRLIELEVKNGVKQIALPGVVKASEVKDVQSEVKSEIKAVEKIEIQGKGKKELKVKEPKGKAPQVPDAAVDVGRLDLRVAKVEEVQRHPDADSLYMLKINCGEEKPRTVCSGLVKHVQMDELKDRFVVLLCNLKPVKMRGVISEAMVMCASSPDKVEVLSPPAGCAPGELVEVLGFMRQPDVVMNPKKKIFETVAPDLHTNDTLEACYKGVPFSVPGKGNVVAQTLKNVAVK